jgi:hypothetical protein
MSKLTLKVDELRVEGFETTALLLEQGTVEGHDDATLACTEKRSCGHICP